MKKICKKLIILFMAVTLIFSAVFFSGCTYMGNKLEGGPATDATVTSQGGWVVKKGSYYYYINGNATDLTLALQDQAIKEQEGDEEVSDGSLTESSGNTSGNTDGSEEESTGIEPGTLIYENTYGEVTKGALLRIHEDDMEGGIYNESKAEMVVPLVVSGENYSNVNSGIFIYGDYVYYATPSTDKNITGERESGYIDFKRSKLDGTGTMKDYYFQSSSSTVDFRFVEVDGVVYCLHIEDGTKLYSYNTKTKEDTLLAKGMSSYAFDDSDASTPYVYYTVGVTVDIDKKNPADQSYNQLYRVRADATAKLNKDRDGYDVTGEDYTHSYVFDLEGYQDIVDDKNEHLEEGEEEWEFSKGKIDTHPYVNLGRPIFDGIGTSNVADSQYNWYGKSEATSPDGYSYTIIKYANGGLYFTRSHVNKVGSSLENGWSFYLSNEKIDADWNAVKNNPDTTANNRSGEYSEFITMDDADVADTSYFYIDGDGNHNYVYQKDAGMEAATVENQDYTTRIVARATTVETFLGMSSSEGYNYLYYTNGTSVCRIVCDADRADYNDDSYNLLLGNNAYRETSIIGAQYLPDWFAPEIVDGYLFFVTNDALGTLTYSYPHVINLHDEDGTLLDNAEIKEMTDRLNEFGEFLSVDVAEFSEMAANIIYYVYFTGDTELALIKDIILNYTEQGYSETYFFSRAELNCVQAYIDRTTYTYNKGVDKIDFTLEDENGEYYGTRAYFQGFIGIVDDDSADYLEEAWGSAYFDQTPDVGGMKPWMWAMVGVSIGVGSVIVLCLLVSLAGVLFRRRRARIAAGGGRIRRRRRRYQVDMNVDEELDVYSTEDKVLHTTEEIASIDEAAKIERVKASTGAAVATPENEAESAQDEHETSNGNEKE